MVPFSADPQGPAVDDVRASQDPGLTTCSKLAVPIHLTPKSDQVAQHVLISFHVKQMHL